MASVLMQEQSARPAVVDADPGPQPVPITRRQQMEAAARALGQGIPA